MWSAAAGVGDAARPPRPRSVAPGPGPVARAADLHLRCSVDAPGTQGGLGVGPAELHQELVRPGVLGLDGPAVLRGRIEQCELLTAARRADLPAVEGPGPDDVRENRRGRRGWLGGWRRAGLGRWRRRRRRAGGG